MIFYHLYLLSSSLLASLCVSRSTQNVCHLSATSHLCGDAVSLTLASICICRINTDLAYGAVFRQSHAVELPQFHLGHTSTLIPQTLCVHYDPQDFCPDCKSLSSGPGVGFVLRCTISANFTGQTVLLCYCVMIQEFLSIFTTTMFNVKLTQH